MADNKNNKKRKYRSDGTGIWQRPIIDGPGVWITCVKGKERQVIGEMYDLFEAISDDLWPDEDRNPKLGEQPLSIEDEIALELKAIKRPRKEHRLASCQTNTPCLIFISCKPPIDPVQLVMTHIRSVRSSGITRTRHTLRLVPVSGSCPASLSEISQLCKKVFGQFFGEPSEKVYSYKIETSIRNHNTLNRDMVLKHIAECVPPQHKVDLKNPEAFILVEIFKAVCGISVVTGYYEFKKFNIQELANAARTDRGLEEQPGSLV